MPKAFTQQQLDAMAAGVDLTPGEPTVPPAEASADDPSVNAEVLELKAQVETLSTAQAALKSQLEEVQATADASVTALTAFAEIARASVRTMGVHFGVKSDAVASMDNTSLLAEHTRLSDLFKDKFKVGGVAATTQESAPAKAVAPPMFAAVMKSTNAK